MTALFILKIIGIVLLAIIGLVLALLLLVLFCPFFYQVKLVKQEQFEGAARLTWLFGFVRLTVSYTDKLNIILRIFGIPIYNQQKKKDKEKNKDKKETKKETTEANTEEITEEITEKITEEITEVRLEEKSEAKSEEPYASDNESEINQRTGQEKAEQSHLTEKDTDIKQEITDSIKYNSKSRKKTTKDKFIYKIKHFFQRVFQYLSEIPDKMIGLKDSIGEKCQKLLDTIEYYQNLAEKPGTKKVIQFLKKEIKLIFRHLKPRRGKVIIDYQSDDPANAAKLMQLYAVTMPILPKQTRVSSVFAEENKLEFQVIIKGRFFLIYLGYHALIILFNKKLKRFISLIKREE